MGLSRRLPFSTSLAWLAAGLPGQEVEVPEFHTDKAKASYVLAVPTDHEAQRPVPLIVDSGRTPGPAVLGAMPTLLHAGDSGALARLVSRKGG